MICKISFKIIDKQLLHIYVKKKVHVKKLLFKAIIIIIYYYHLKLKIMNL